MPPRHQWLLGVLLFSATLLNYLDRQTISVSAPVIAEELHLSDLDLGHLFFGFLFSYGLAQLFAGPLLDRFRTVPAYAIAVLAWSAMGAGSSLTAGFAGLLAMRLLLGICEAPNWPLALRVTARVFPAHQRPFVIGLFQSGSSIGTLVAPPLIIWLTHHWGWRIAFVACGSLGLLWAAGWLAVTRAPWAQALDQTKTAAEAAIPPATPASLGGILRSPAFWGLAVATSLMNPLQYLYTTWLPRYFTTYAGVEFGEELATRLMLVYFFLDLGLWLGGAAVVWGSRRFRMRNVRIGVAGFGALGMAMIPLATVCHSLNLITAVICTAMFGLGCFIVNYLAYVTEVSTTRVATAAGLLGGIGSLAGAGFMLLVGSAVQAEKSFDQTFFWAGFMPVGAFIGLLYCAFQEPRRTAAEPAPGGAA